MNVNKTTILLWLVILLSILNITTIATIILHNKDEKDMKSIIVEPEAQPINGKYFRHELGFNKDQMEVFRQNNRMFRHKANRIVMDINQQKQTMFDELQSTNPDTTKLNTISTKIGSLHTELKHATVQFYLALSKVCNVDQKEKMKTIFTPLFIESSLRNKGNRGNECKYGNPNNNLN